MKRNATFSVQAETPANLRALAKQLGIVHVRGVGALDKIGSASGLIDYISHLVQTDGVEAIAAKLSEESNAGNE